MKLLDWLIRKLQNKKNLEEIPDEGANIRILRGCFENYDDDDDD